MKIALLPARAGSKRIPGKNIRSFGGAPMIAHPIRAARASGLFDRILVSTDSEEIAEIARHEGADAPFLRPSELSDDHTATHSVLLHALDWLKSAQGYGEPEFLCCIYPCAPFLEAQDLRQGFDRMTAAHADGAFAVVEFESSPYRALKVGKEGKFEMLFPEHRLTRSNDLPKTYHDAGMFYWLKTATFRKTARVWADDAVLIPLPRERAIDIDTEADWRRAEALLAAR